MIAFEQHALAPDQQLRVTAVHGQRRRLVGVDGKAEFDITTLRLARHHLQIGPGKGNFQIGRSRGRP